MLLLQHCPNELCIVSGQDTMWGYVDGQYTMSEYEDTGPMRFGHWESCKPIGRAVNQAALGMKLQAQHGHCSGPLLGCP